MKELIAEKISNITGLSKEEIFFQIEIPPSRDLGDYALPCFFLTKSLNKSPSEISLFLSQKINKEKNLEYLFEKVESKGPYINFFIKPDFILQQLIKKMSQKKKKEKPKKEKIMVEFSQANTHKAFHIGHVRGTSLGESISRIIEFCGNKVIRVNYQGDSGMHVAKWLWCYLKFHSNEPLKKSEEWIASIYVDAVKRLSENNEFQKEVEEINFKLEKRSDPFLNALWKKTRELSLKSFEKIYKDLNTHFDYYFFESKLEKLAKIISSKLLKKGIAEMSEGALIMDLKKFNLGVWVLLRKDGTVLYSAKDLALAELKFRKFNIDKSIYVVGSSQRTHFNQLFKTLELMGFNKAKNCVYLPVTEVRLPTGKMSSRTGENVLYSSFKKELIEYAKNEIKKRDPLISKKELENRANKLAISSIKYAMLKQDINKTIVFNKEEALSFDGDSGPYILYSYARARSILRKAKFKINRLNSKRVSFNENEKNLLILLNRFEETIDSAFNKLSPDIIANYTFSIAQNFNEFYHSNQVIGSDKESLRLFIVYTFSLVLKKSLFLLGIDVLEKM